MIVVVSIVGGILLGFLFYCMVYPPLFARVQLWIMVYIIALGIMFLPSHVRRTNSIFMRLMRAAQGKEDGHVDG